MNILDSVEVINDILINDYSYTLTKATRKIKLKTPLTGELKEYNIYGFLGSNYGSSVSVVFENKSDIFSHYNLDSTLGSFKYRDKEYFIQAFCNSLSKEDEDFVFKDDPKLYTILLQNLLEQPNPGDAYKDQTENLFSSVSLTEKDFAIKCECCSEFIAKDASHIELITGYCSECLQREEGVLYDLVDSEVKENKKGFFIKPKKFSSYKYCKNKRGMSKKLLSEYYNEIKVENIDEMIPEIPKLERDMIVLGLGSAGSNIVSQVVRTNYINKFTLVDFDIVEEKNLRNQIYRRNHIKNDKTYSTKEIINSIKPNIFVETKTDKFQNANLERYSSKYMVLGFDSVKTRYEAFEKIKSKEYDVKYIIDIRYDGLEASIYFVDTSNEDEMSHYEKFLLEDIKLLTPKERMSKEEIEKTWIDKGYFEKRCIHGIAEALDISYEDVFDMVSCGASGVNECGSESCMNFLHTIINNYEKTPPENTCIRQNIIDIYTFASSYITAAMREIENEKKKPFTHVEVSTESGLPGMMVLKK